jgi:predicted ATPase
MNKKLIIISGCSGGGKSTLLDELKDNGYSVIPEVGRGIVKQQLEIDGNATPWQNPIAFCELAIQKSIANYEQTHAIKSTTDKMIFFDRCFLDGVSYYQSLELDDARKYDYLIQDLRFYPTVFMTPPWGDIYCQDDERKHSFEDAVAEYERLLKFYLKNGYQIVEIPKVSVKERFHFLISTISDAEKK